MKTFFKKTQILVSNSIPSFFIDKYILSKVKMPKVLSDKYVIRIAKNQNEIEEAFRLLQDSYVEEGYAVMNESKLRITNFHLLPTTIVLIICFENKVVGTMSIIRSGKMGIPLDSMNIQNVLNKKELYFEVSSLAIAKNHRQNSGELFLWLIKFALHLTIQKMKLTTALIGVHPKWIPFYRSVLSFVEIKGLKANNYSFANGNPLATMKLDLENFEKISSNPMHKEFKPIHCFYNLPLPANAFMPNYDLLPSNIGGMSASQMEELLLKKTSILQSLNPNDLKHTMSSYQNKEHQDFFRNFFPTERRSFGNFRHLIHFQVQNLANGCYYKTFDISYNGISLMHSEFETMPKLLTLQIHSVFANQIYSINLLKLRSIDSCKTAYRIISTSKFHMDFIDKLNNITLQLNG
jgi:hypothetical protein